MPRSWPPPAPASSGVPAPSSRPVQLGPRNRATVASPTSRASPIAASPNARAAPASRRTGSNRQIDRMSDLRDEFTCPRLRIGSDRSTGHHLPSPTAPKRMKSRPSSGTTAQVGVRRPAPQRSRPPAPSRQLPAVPGRRRLWYEERQPQLHRTPPSGSTSTSSTNHGRVRLHQWHMGADRD